MNRHADRRAQPNAFELQQRNHLDDDALAEYKDGWNHGAIHFAFDYMEQLVWQLADPAERLALTQALVTSAEKLLTTKGDRDFPRPAA